MIKPARICPCGEKVQAEDLCTCQQKAKQDRNARHDHKRPSASARGYGRKWRKARDEFLAVHRYCAECTRNNRTALATLVDHIIPHKGDKRLFWNRANWQPLCTHCHSSTKQQQERNI